nr:phospholipase [Deltaproteobacteria bacterium]
MLSRREMLFGSAAGLATLASGRTGFAKKRLLPHPENSGIKHVVVVTVENRSFDHLLGWLPGADGMQEGLIYGDSAGNQFETYALAPDYQGCLNVDPD